MVMEVFSWQVTHNYVKCLFFCFLLKSISGKCYANIIFFHQACPQKEM